MQELPSILLQRGIASEREVAEAVARSELHGGHLVTSLLQFAEVQEKEVLEALADCYGLPAAPAGLLPQPDHRALTRIPREVAERYCVTPLSSIGSVLVVAVSEPLERGVEEELGYALGIELRPRVALEVRIRQAIARDYQAPLAPRHQRGIARLEADFENAPEETPMGSWPVSRLSRLPRPPSEPPRPKAHPPSVTPAPARANPSQRPRPRGPVTLTSARQRLIKERSRDGVLAAYFGFVSQYFEYAALFAVHNALAEGLDASGPGASSQTVRTIGAPLDLQSSMATAVESGEPLLGPLREEGLDQTFLQDLERSTKEAVLLLPIRLRSRTVLLLYADNGSTAVRASDLGDVLSLSKDVGQALERLILQRKRSLKMPSTSAKTSSIASFPPPTIDPDTEQEDVPYAAPEQPAPAPQEAVPATTSPSLRGQRMVSIEPPAAPASPPSSEARTRETPAGEDGKREAEESPEEPEEEITEKPFLLDRSRSTKPPDVTPRSAPPQTSISYPPQQRITRRLPSVIVSDEAEQPPGNGSTPPPRKVAAPRPPPSTKPEAQAQSRPAPSQPTQSRPGAQPEAQTQSQPEQPEASAQPEAEKSSRQSPEEQARATPLAAPIAPPSPFALAPDSTKPFFVASSIQTTQLDSEQAPTPGSIDDLVQRALSGSASAARELASKGQEDSLSALLQHFPGPVISERAGPNSKASECGPLLQALANIGAPATLDISRFSHDSDDNVRRWATLLLGELPSPEACRAVAERLGDPAPRVRQAATDAARLLLRSNAANLFRKTLFEMASSSETQDHLRLRALEHIARLQDNASVPRLVQMLKETHGTLAHKVMWALTVITRQDFGRDVEQWTLWWQEHQSQHRVQWLIEALTHGDLRLRRAAWEELKRETGSGYDYDATAPLDERIAGQQRYRDWWKSTGARRFGRLC